MKLIIFTEGDVKPKDIEKPKTVSEIVCIIDNDSSKWNTFFCGIKILPPPMVRYIEYDRILMLTANHKATANQLLALGVPKEKIWNNILFSADMSKGNLKIYGSQINYEKAKKILIISYGLRYDGSTVAALHVRDALKNRGYDVTIASFGGDAEFIKEQSGNGNVIIICYSLLYPHNEELAWIKLFDAVIVNTYPMIACASSICKIKPVIWWIHECNHELGNAYVMPLEIYWNMDYWRDFPNMSIYAVSSIAKANFKNYYPEAELGIMPYGIPDTYDGKAMEQCKDKLVFAIVGNVCPRKAQDIFVSAAKLMERELADKTEFWIIGKSDNDEYNQKLRDEISNMDNIKFCGEMTRDEISNAYMNDIDVVVVASYQECLSVVITEAMMYGKPIITTDVGGHVVYMKDYINGRICRVGDVDDLRDKMEWMIVNRDKLGEMGQNARKTYEEYFTMDKFADRLENALEKTIRDYRELN
jgi:glycosyltransferase involved in cell wall biosynthesis